MERGLAAGRPADGFLPSLHLSLGLAEEDVGDCDSAARHRRLAAEAARVLAEDGYGSLARRGIAAALGRLETARARTARLRSSRDG